MRRGQLRHIIHYQVNLGCGVDGHIAGDVYQTFLEESESMFDQLVEHSHALLAMADIS
jgi:hypothetical protein